MSDMIDRLKAISAGAGRDIAADLSSASTRRSMESRVRVGVKRRRTRLGFIAASVAVVVATAAIAAPALLSSAPQLIEPAREVVRSVGPITVFDDGSMSAVLANGKIVYLVAGDDAMTLAAPTSDAMCAVAGPADLPSEPWTPSLEESNNIVRFFATSISNSEGERITILPGDTFSTASLGDDLKVAVAIQTDPAMAPYIVTRVATYDFAANGAGGMPQFTNAYSSSSLNGAPEVTYSGDAALGTRTGTVVSTAGKAAHWAKCYEPGDESMWDGSESMFVVTEIFLTDRQGAFVHLGTYTSWFATEDGAS